MFKKKKSPEEEYQRVEMIPEEADPDFAAKPTESALLGDMDKDSEQKMMEDKEEQSDPEDDLLSENISDPEDDLLSESISEPEDITEGESVPPERFKGLKRILLGIVILAASVILTFGYSLWSEYSRSESYEGKEVTVAIPEGSSTRQMAAILKDTGVIRYETPFLVKMYFSEYRGKLRYGTFRLNDGLCLDDVVKKLSTEGAIKDEASFTVPEGYSVEMIAAKLQEEEIMSSEEFLSAVERAAEGFIYADQLPAKDQVFYQLQGYLFPDTYHISENMTGDQLVKKMLEQFLAKFDEKRRTQAKKAGLTVEEVLIRASLVQKETEKAEEYAMIAGVINNRLAEDMKLQFDSTTVYAMTKGMYGVSRVTYDDLKLQSVYNTYYVKGLPAGPICNPGIEAIDGVLNAKKHNYLYFQMDREKNDGSNLFFETYEEHEAASATTGTTEDTAAATGTTEDAAATTGTVTDTAETTGTTKDTAANAQNTETGAKEKDTKKKME